MKRLNLKLALIIVISGLLFANCNGSDSVDIVEVDSLSENDALLLIESDGISNDIDNIIDDVIYGVEEISNKEELSSKENDKEKFRIPECATRTVVESGNTKIVTIDFGEECEVHDDNILSGIIIMTLEKNGELGTSSITKTFDNFFFNGVEVTGEKSIVRVRNNENGNRQSTTIMNITHTWPEGEFNTRTGTKVREWVEGADTKHWRDNVFRITGEWKNTLKNGEVYSSKIIEALQRDMDCKFIVSGIMEVSKPKVLGTIYFGDGTCDNLAILKREGEEDKEITLKKRKRKKR